MTDAPEPELAPIDRREVLYFLGLALSYFVLVKIVDWLAAGFLVETFGPGVGSALHAGLFGLVLLGFAVRGVLRLRDRFSLAVGLAIVALPAAGYLLARFG